MCDVRKVIWWWNWFTEKLNGFLLKMFIWPYITWCSFTVHVLYCRLTSQVKSPQRTTATISSDLNFHKIFRTLHISKTMSGIWTASKTQATITLNAVSLWYYRRPFTFYLFVSFIIMSTVLHTVCITLLFVFSFFVFLIFYYF